MASTKPQNSTAGFWAADACNQNVMSDVYETSSGHPKSARLAWSVSVCLGIICLQGINSCAFKLAPWQNMLHRDHKRLPNTAQYLSLVIDCLKPWKALKSLPDSSAQLSMAWVASFKSVCSDITELQHSDTATVRELSNGSRPECFRLPWRVEIWPATSTAPMEKALLQKNSYVSCLFLGPWNILSKSWGFLLKTSAELQISQSAQSL